VRVSRIYATTDLTLESSPKAERTRVAILAAAEEQFARRGYVATRLEDIAAAVGLKRAALFYHFKDKQTLYDAVITGTFSSLVTRLEEAFSAQSPIAARVERGTEIWVEEMVARPALARLILRHAAEAEEHAAHDIFPGAARLLGTAWSLLESGRAKGELRPVHDNPFHAASAVLGATVFYVVGFSAFLPDADFGPPSSEQVNDHKQSALQTLRLLLGIRAKPAKATKATKVPKATKATKVPKVPKATKAAKAKATKPGKIRRAR
jgi:TetR/AcrR family transcriptional regulator